MKMDKWNERFIEPEKEIDIQKQQPAAYIRKEYQITKKIRSARIYMTALGNYIGYINGYRLGNEQLMPGYTDYHFRLQVQSYDVTSYIKNGINVIGAVIGDGWYRGCIDIGSVRNSYGERLKFFCCLQLEYDNGEKEDWYTDESWKATTEGPLRENNTKTIERVDFTKDLGNWLESTYDDHLWYHTKKSVYDGKLIRNQGEKILEHEHFIPRIIHTPDGNTVLDMGQNFTGYVRFTVNGKKGHKSVLTMGEVLDENGNFTLKNLSAEGASAISGEVGQRLECIFSDKRITYQPHFLISGFRYVLVENWPQEVNSENFTGIAVYSDLKYDSTFECSNPLINQLVKNVRWSQKSNFVDIPTDCPTRERSGWTADVSVFCETACYLSNPRKFLKKWLQDYKAEQDVNGNLPFVVPSAGKTKRQWGCMGWSNAIVNISMVLYHFYGKKEDLEDVYECTKKFVEFNRQRARKRNPLFFFKHGKHRKYIIETGFHYGEWLEPGRTMYQDYIKDMFYPDVEVTTAWFYKTVSQLAEMAEILGKTEEQKEYIQLAENIYKAYEKEFLTYGLSKRKGVNSKRQCRYVRPLSMNLVASELKNQTAELLNKMIINNNYQLGTGFLTTYKLLQVLTENGYSDTAYHLLENKNSPGWLYAVTKGATTTWENWYGLTEKGKPVDSHNHFAPGAVVGWLFAYCAGITPEEPGFEKIKIAPVPGGSLRYAKCKYESIKGTIISEWTRENGRIKFHIVTPHNIPTKICLPGLPTKDVQGGEYEFSIAENIVKS